MPKTKVFAVRSRRHKLRTFKRFCGLIAQLLQKLSVRASNGPEKLMQVVKQPVTSILARGLRRGDSPATRGEKASL